MNLKHADTRTKPAPFQVRVEVISRSSKGWICRADHNNEQISLPIDTPHFGILFSESRYKHLRINSRVVLKGRLALGMNIRLLAFQYPERINYSGWCTEQEWKEAEYALPQVLEEEKFVYALTRDGKDAYINDTFGKPTELVSRVMVSSLPLGKWVRLEDGLPQVTNEPLVVKHAKKMKYFLLEYLGELDDKSSVVRNKNTPNHILVTPIDYDPAILGSDWRPGQGFKAKV